MQLLIMHYLLKRSCTVAQDGNVLDCTVRFISVAWQSGAYTRVGGGLAPLDLGYIKFVSQIIQKLFIKPTQ